ncbi:Regulator of microtubule dynamics protein 2 [Myotis brandtii]|uniref:Regulator of microtubule dynamics protein 2 n=1 Tax=Myotis brandtii TaxID=109478 RepID=S7MR22_MYOBR|nr:Regulator of microtubule dynamics protein 2 [Myotis brandtii]
MPHSTNKELILGIMVGTTGISLLLLWYHKVCKPRTAMNLPKFLSLGNAFDLVTSQDEMQNDQGTAAIYQGRQLQILEKLNELLTNMEELREEIRILKETIPKLEECVCGELGGKTTAHRISPQHRSRKRRLATVQSSGTSNSSEEAESEGGCYKKDQNFQQYCPEDRVTSDPLHHGTSSVTREPNFHDLPANYAKIQKSRRASPPAVIQQQTSESANSVPPNVAFASFYKPSRKFTPVLMEVNSNCFDGGNIAQSSQDEDKSSPIEIPNLRYITASTDTEEQSFPVRKALNRYVEELNLDALLQKADNLRMDESKKMESFELLCDHKEKFRDEIEFIWRLARAYGDMYELSTNTEEKKHYANIGKTLGEKAVTRAPMNGHCHLWYAVLCGYVSEFEGLQNKVNYGYCFKEHLDKAIQLLPAEPFLYYLNGRYCYAVSKLSWIEKKMAATLFGKIPTSTIQEALQNFLKAEELHPGFSKSNYMYLSKCYRDLKETENAMKFHDLAEQLPCITKEDKNAEEEMKK